MKAFFSGLARPSLQSLARRHGTDKLEHGYMAAYVEQFARLRRLPLRLLEIGVCEGASLRMWRDYFPRAQIFGLDIEDKRHLAEPRITIFQGDQSDPDRLRTISAEAGGFDVVIDDGSHVATDILTAFDVLFPLLGEAGIYIIEDLHTSYWRRFGGGRDERTAMSLLKERLDGLNCHWIPGRTPDDLDLSIRSVCCYPKIAFIHKGANPRVMRPNELRRIEETLQERASD